MTLAEQLRLEQAAYVAAVAGKLTDFLTTRQAVMSSISPDIDPLMGSISNLVTGGKRLRALMCYWGWRGAGGEAGAGRGGDGRLGPGALPGRGPHPRRHHRPLRHPPGRPQRAPALQRTARDAGLGAGQRTIRPCGRHPDRRPVPVLQRGVVYRNRAERSVRKPGTADLQPDARRSHGGPVPRHPRGSRGAQSGPRRCRQPGPVHHPLQIGQVLHRASAGSGRRPGRRQRRAAAGLLRLRPPARRGLPAPRRRPGSLRRSGHHRASRPETISAKASGRY